MNAHISIALGKPEACILTETNLKFGTKMSYEPEETVYREGDQAAHYYEVVSGSVRACMMLADGRRQVLEFYLPGDIFGFDDVDSVHTLNAEASSEIRTVVMRHHRRSLESRAAADPVLSGRLRELALRDLIRARYHALVLGRLGAVERVGAFLLDLHDRLRHGPTSRDQGFSLPMSRRDISDYLGITPETLSRSMQILRRRGAIALPGQRHVRILNRSMLTTESDDDRATDIRAHASSYMPQLA